MKNYLNKSVFKGIKRELAKVYGVDKSDEIWRYADSEYHKLETGETDPDKTSRSYVFCSFNTSGNRTLSTGRCSWGYALIWNKNGVGREERSSGHFGYR